MDKISNYRLLFFIYFIIYLFEWNINHILTKLNSKKEDNLDNKKKYNEFD